MTTDQTLRLDDPVVGGEGTERGRWNPFFHCAYEGRSYTVHITRNPGKHVAEQHRTLLTRLKKGEGILIFSFSFDAAVYSFTSIRPSCSAQRRNSLVLIIGEELQPRECCGGVDEKRS